MIPAQRPLDETPATAQGRRLRFAGALLLVIAAATIPYLGSSSSGFLYDDVPYIVANPQVRGPDVTAVFSRPLPPDKPELGLYRPLTVLSYRLQAPKGLLGRALGFHLVNIGLHAACGVVLSLLALAFGMPLATATIVGTLFVTHPACVESVAWIVGRAELLAALLCLLALLAHQRIGNSARRLPLVGLALLAACASKENALAFPAVLVTVSLVDPAKRSRHRLAADIALFVAVLGSVLLVRAQVLGRLAPDPRGAPLDPGGLLARLATAADLLAHYLRFIVWPHPSRIFYHASEFSSPGLLDVVTLAAFLGLAWLAVRHRGRAIVGLAWIVVCLIPVLNIVPIQESFAERFLYLPTAGACLAAGFALSAWMERERRTGHGPLFSLMIPGVLILLGLASTASRAPDFNSSIALWEHEVRVTPRQAYAHYNLGLAYEQAAPFPSSGRAQRRRALAEYRKSLEISPTHRYAAYTHLQLAQAALNTGRYTTAATRYREAIRLGGRQETLMDGRHRLAAFLGLAHVHRLAPDEVGEQEAANALVMALPLASGSELQGPVKQMLRELDTGRSKTRRSMTPRESPEN